MQAATAYIQTQMLGPKFAAELMISEADASVKMTAATTDYYRTWLNSLELMTRVQGQNADRVSAVHKAYIEQGIASRMTFIDLMKSSAQQAGQQASAAINAMHAQASISGSENMLDNNL
jgi:sulfatase maturation enzyme AslB (radical SAM superfamily)